MPTYKTRSDVYREREGGSEWDSFTLEAVPEENTHKYKPIRNNPKFDTHIIDIRIQRLPGESYKVHPELDELQRLLNTSQKDLNVQMWCWPCNSHYFLAHSDEILDPVPILIMHPYLTLLFSHAHRWRSFRLYADLFFYNQQRLLKYVDKFHAPRLRSMALQNAGDLIGSPLQEPFRQFATKLIAGAPSLREFILIDHTRKLPTCFISPILPLSKLSSLRMGNDPTVVEMYQVLRCAPALVRCAVDNLRESHTSEVQVLREFRCPSLESLRIRYNLETMFRPRPGVDTEMVRVGTLELMQVIRAPRLTQLAIWYDERWDAEIFQDFVVGSGCHILELEIVDPTDSWLASPHQTLLRYLELCPFLKRLRLSTDERLPLLSKEIMKRMTYSGKRPFLPDLEVLEVKDEALDVQFASVKPGMSDFGRMVRSRVKTTPLKKVVIMSPHLKFNGGDWDNLWFYERDAQIMEGLHKQGDIEVILEEYYVGPARIPHSHLDFTRVDPTICM